MACGRGACLPWSGMLGCRYLRRVSSSRSMMATTAAIGAMIPLSVIADPENCHSEYERRYLASRPASRRQLKNRGRPPAAAALAHLVRCWFTERRRPPRRMSSRVRIAAVLLRMVRCGRWRWTRASGGDSGTD
jgi:hypothetical protein